MCNGTGVSPFSSKPKATPGTPLQATYSLSPMETVQERELQKRTWWPLNTMTCRSLDMSSSSNGCSFLFEWDPQLGYFGLGLVSVAAAAGDPGDHRTTLEHEVQLFFPKCMESPGSSEAPVEVNTGLPAAPEDATVIAEDPLDEFLWNFWDGDEYLQCFSSSCILMEDTTTTGCFLADDDLLAVTSASPAGPTLPDETAAQKMPAEQLPRSSFSSHCTVEPQAGETGGAGQDQRRANCSFKRPANDPDAWTWSGSKRNRKAATSGSSVVRPFTVVKPGGADGVLTLADINERILMPPPRPVRHPVGEFACSPRASAGGDPRLSPSGKTVTGFTRLYTGGKGTITIIRTTG